MTVIDPWIIDEESRRRDEESRDGHSQRIEMPVSPGVNPGMGDPGQRRPPSVPTSNPANPQQSTKPPMPTTSVDILDISPEFENVIRW